MDGGLKEVSKQHAKEDKKITKHGGFEMSPRWSSDLPAIGGEIIRVKGRLGILSCYRGHPDLGC